MDKEKLEQLIINHSQLFVLRENDTNMFKDGDIRCFGKYSFDYLVEEILQCVANAETSDSKLDLYCVSNLIFTGIGYCGMSKDIEVRGRLTEVRKQHSHATITDEKGQPHAVNLKTVKICC